MDDPPLDYGTGSERTRDLGPLQPRLLLELQFPLPPQFLSCRLQPPPSRLPEAPMEPRNCGLFFKLSTNLNTSPTQPTHYPTSFAATAVFTRSVHARRVLLLILSLTSSDLHTIAGALCSDPAAGWLVRVWDAHHLTCLTFPLPRSCLRLPCPPS